MSTPRIPAPLQSPASSSGEARPVLRAKTIATRVTPEELAEVETLPKVREKLWPNGCASWP